MGFEWFFINIRILFDVTFKSDFRVVQVFLAFLYLTICSKQNDDWIIFIFLLKCWSIIKLVNTYHETLYSSNLKSTTERLLMTSHFWGYKPSSFRSDVCPCCQSGNPGLPCPWCPTVFDPCCTAGPLSRRHSSPEIKSVKILMTSLICDYFFCQSIDLTMTTLESSELHYSLLIIRCIDLVSISPTFYARLF